MTRGFRITNVVGRGGRVLTTRFQPTLEGGPELAKVLAGLDDAVRVKASKESILAAGGVLAEEWQRRVPVLDAEYQRSLEGAERAGRTKAGASGSVGPRHVSGLSEDEQPARYAPRLEYGDADRPAEPSARPAFDAGQERPVRAAADVLRRAAEGVAR